MTVLEEIAAFVVDANFSALSDADRAIADRHFSDTLVALAAGSLIPEGRSLLPLSGSAAFAERIGLLSATARLTEIDDIHIGSCVTPSSVAVPVGLGVTATTERATDGDTRSAIWAGLEVMTWIGTAMRGPYLLSRGVWPTFAVAPAGAAAVSARLLGLNEKQTAHSLSLALMLMAGGTGHFQGKRSGRWFLFSSGVAAGIRAAMAAKEGYTGDLSLLDGDWLSRSHGIDLQRLSSLPHPERSIYRKLSMKPYCSAKQSISAIEAFGTLVDEIGSADEILGVTVKIPEIFRGMISRPAIPGSRSSTLVSLKHQIALRACDPEALFDIDRSQQQFDRIIMDFAERVDLMGETSLMEDLENFWGAEVTVELPDGQRTKAVSQVCGDPDHALQESDLRRKWRLVFSRLGAEEYGERVISAVQNAPASPESSRRLFQLCAPDLIS